MVAQFKFTVLLMPNGPQKITGLPFDATLFESEHSIVDEEIKKLLSSSTRPKKPNKKKKAEVAKVSRMQSCHSRIETSKTVSQDATETASETAAE